MGGGWNLVRRVKEGDLWHQATDNLALTDTYGTFVENPVVDASFSRPWNGAFVTDFLFATGDETKWLVASRNAVLGEYYDNSDRDVEMSSLSTSRSSVKWIYKEDEAHGPWISLTDNADAISSGNMLYAENGASGASTTLVGHKGANVFVKSCKPVILTSWLL